MSCCDCSEDHSYSSQPNPVPRPRIRLVVHPQIGRFGSHLSLRQTLTQTLEAHNIPCCQFYLGGNTNYQCREITAVDRANAARYCATHDKTFYVHCSLIANLAKPNDADVVESVKSVTKSLHQIAGLPGACVLHIGKVGSLENVARRVNEITEGGALPSGTGRVPRKLLLEIAAGQGTELGRSWEELRRLYEGIDRSRVGFCFDTQHAFAAGMSPMQSHEDIVKLFDEAEAILPRGIGLIHINDSKKVFGSRVDRHEVLGMGHIWGQTDEGLRVLTHRCLERGIDMVSETGDGMADCALLSSYCKDV